MPAQETAHYCSSNRMQRLGLREWPSAKASSRLETGNDSDGLCRSRSAVFGREHLHLRPVVRELTAAIEANNVSPCHGCCCSAAAQLAAHGNGKLQRLCQQPKTRSNTLISPPRLKPRRMPPSDFRPSPKREPGFGYLAAISVSEPVALTASALPVPTASTKQKHNHGNNQNRF